MLICLGCVQGWRRKRGSGLVVRAEMFGQLTTGLESAWNKLRGTGEFLFVFDAIFLHVSCKFVVNEMNESRRCLYWFKIN